MAMSGRSNLPSKASHGEYSFWNRGTPMRYRLDGAWPECFEGAFDKEPLTRDFFKRFDDALEAIKADLE